MKLPEPVRRVAEQELAKFCERRVPPHAQNSIRLSFAVRGSSLTLFEERQAFLKPGQWTKMPIAQFRYDEDGCWTLYCADRNDRWHEYIETYPLKDIRELIEEVDEDPTGIFWG